MQTNRIIPTLAVLAFLLLTACQSTYIKVPRSGLPAFLSYESHPGPWISAHRGGGMYTGYPENCLESFQMLIETAPMLIECDVRMTADSVLVLMHDRSVDRTTTGTGRVEDLRWEYLQTLTLKDNQGNPTLFRIPTLEQALKWTKGKAILTLDVKRGVPFEQVITTVEANRAERYAAIITYNLTDAKKVYGLNPTLAISASMRNAEESEAFFQSGIPPQNLIAFTGTRLSSDSLYTAHHQAGILNILGTLGNLDRMAAANGDSLYKVWLAKGVDILATDRPKEVVKALYDLPK